MNKDQIKGRVEEAKGKVKEAAGVILDDDSLGIEGNVQKNVGKIQSGWAISKKTSKKTNSKKVKKGYMLGLAG